MISFIIFTNIFLITNFCENLYVSLTNSKPSEENIQVCSLVLEDSKLLKVPIEIGLSIAWVESRFTAQLKPTKYNCIGPFQIKIQYWCKNKSLKYCDPFYDGAKAIKYYIEKFKPINKAFCYYNNSKKKKCSHKYDFKTLYVKDVLSAKKKIEDLLSHKKFVSIIKN